MSPQERGYRLFVGNLPPTVDSAKLREVFGPCTPLNAKVATNQRTGKSAGFGHVDFASEEEMTEAQLLMNGFLLDGKAMSVYIEKRYTGSRSMNRRSGVALEAEAAATRWNAETKAAELAKTAKISPRSRRTGSGSSWFPSFWSPSGGQSARGLSSSKSFNSGSEGKTRRSKSMSGADIRSWSLLGSLSFRRSSGPVGGEQIQEQLEGSRRKR